MLRGQAAAGVLLVDIGALGDADQRIVRLVHVGLGEVDIVGRDQRNVHRIGHFHVAALGQALGLGRCAVFAGVALQFDVEAVAETGVQALQQCLGLGAVAGLQQHTHGAEGAAGQADQPIAERLQFVQRDLRRLPALVDVEAAVELHQVFVTALGLGQQHDGRRVARALTRLRLDIGHVDLTAEDRLDACPAQRHRHLERREHVVGVGHGDSRHAGGFAEARQLLEADGALQQRVFGVEAEVNESGGTAHAPRLSGGARGGNWRRAECGRILGSAPCTPRRWRRSRTG